MKRVGKIVLSDANEDMDQLRLNTLFFGLKEVVEHIEAILSTPGRITDIASNQLIQLTRTTRSRSVGRANRGNWGPAAQTQNMYRDKHSFNGSPPFARTFFSCHSAWD